MNHPGIRRRATVQVLKVATREVLDLPGTIVRTQDLDQDMAIRQRVIVKARAQMDGRVPSMDRHRQATALHREHPMVDLGTMAQLRQATDQHHMPGTAPQETERPPHRQDQTLTMKHISATMMAHIRPARTRMDQHPPATLDLLEQEQPPLLTGQTEAEHPRMIIPVVDHTTASGTARIPPARILAVSKMVMAPMISPLDIALLLELGTLILTNLHHITQAMARRSGPAHSGPLQSLLLDKKFGFRTKCGGPDTWQPMICDALCKRGAFPRMTYTDTRMYCVPTRKP